MNLQFSRTRNFYIQLKNRSYGNVPTVTKRPKPLVKLYLAVQGFHN